MVVPSEIGSSGFSLQMTAVNCEKNGSGGAILGGFSTFESRGRNIRDLIGRCDRYMTGHVTRFIVATSVTSHHT